VIIFWIADIICRFPCAKGPGAFVCGEETALIASLEGRRGMPSSKPPYPATSGYLGRPTVVNNVETLSNLPAIVREGPEWFRVLVQQDVRAPKSSVCRGG
jgi:NADH:ubiquinone oxidoreductase subunit F (NADH-binding)